MFHEVIVVQICQSGPKTVLKETFLSFEPARMKLFHSFFFQWQKYMVKRHKITQQKYNSTQTQNCQPAFDHFKPNVPSVLSCCSSRHGLPSHPASYWLLHPQTHLCTSDERLVRLPRGKWPDFTSFWIVTEIITCSKCIYGTFYTTGHSVVYIHYVLYCQAYIL